MSDATTRTMIAAYFEEARRSLFLSGMFQTPRENFFSTEEVEFDIVRGDEDVAIVVQDMRQGHRRNSADVFTNKKFIPPVFKESGPLNVFDLIKRQPGQHPFAATNFQTAASTKAMQLFRKMENKIRRSMELQASQVMQSGTITLSDSAGVALYTIDYQPKVTHFPTAGTAWDGVTPDIAGDIDSLADVVRADGKLDPDELVMGKATFEAFVNDPVIRVRLDTRRIDLGAIGPMQSRGEGGKFRGSVEIGQYRYDIWTYDGRFTDPQTEVSTQYITDDTCIVRASGGRMDAVFGAIPQLVPVEDRVLPFLPERLSSDGMGIDIIPRAWIDDPGENLIVAASSRPLMIPTAIDTFGRIDTGV